MAVSLIPGRDLAPGPRATLITSAARERFRAVGTFDAKGVGRVYRYDVAGRLRQVGENADLDLRVQHWTVYGSSLPSGALLSRSEQWMDQTLQLHFQGHRSRRITQGLQRRLFRHDSLGRLVRVEHPEFLHQEVQQATVYEYDDGGRLTRRIDPRGVSATMVYDDLVRTLSMACSDAAPGRGLRLRSGQHASKPFPFETSAASRVSRGSLSRNSRTSAMRGLRRCCEISVAKSMIKRRAESAVFDPREACCHTYRATAISDPIRNGGAIEEAHDIAGHTDLWTTCIYDRTSRNTSIDKVEKIRICSHPYSNRLAPTAAIR